MPDADLEPTVQCLEARRVVLWRFTEARKDGLTRVEARMFAESAIDVGLLRRLVAGGCPKTLIAKILL